MKSAAERKAVRHAHYLAHRDEIIAKNRAYREAHPDAVREQRRSWGLRHRGSKAEYNRAYYARTREQQLADKREYGKANAAAIRDRVHSRYVAQRDLRRAQNAAYLQTPRGKAAGWAARARRYGLTVAAETIAWAERLYSDPCAYCGGPGGEIDHIVPLSKDGPTVPDNLTASCRTCNRCKRNKSALVFLCWLVAPHKSRSKHAAAQRQECGSCG